MSNQNDSGLAVRENNTFSLERILPERSGKSIHEMLSLLATDPAVAGALALGMTFEQRVPVMPGDKVLGIWRGFGDTELMDEATGELKPAKLVRIEVSPNIIATFVADWQLTRELENYPEGTSIFLLRGNQVPGRGTRRVNTWFVGKLNKAAQQTLDLEFESK